jgi:hypothetical protein
MTDNPADRFSTVCSLDLAIDHAASNIKAFVDTRKIEHLRYVPGRKPILYWLRPIPSELFTNFVEHGSGPEERWRRAFIVGVEAIDNIGPLGRWAPSWPARQADGTDVMIIDDRGFAEVRKMIGWLAPIYEIGRVAYERELLGKALDVGAVSWSLPPSSQAVLDRLTPRRAVRTPPPAETTSSATSARSSETTSAPPSAPPSDAGADPSGGTGAAGASSP